MLLVPCSAACVWELIFSLFHFACVGWGGLGWGMLMFTCSCQCYVRHGPGLKRVLVGAGEENHPPEEDVKKMRCECWQCRQSMVCLPVVVKSLVLVVVHSRVFVVVWNFGNLVLVLVVVKTYSPGYIYNIQYRYVCIYIYIYLYII